MTQTPTRPACSVKLHISAHAADAARSRRDSEPFISLGGESDDGLLSNNVYSDNRIESYHTMTAASGVDLAQHLVVHYARNQLVHLSTDLELGELVKHPIAAREGRPRTCYRLH